MSPLMVMFAIMKLPVALAILAGILVITDWLDGLLARWLRQRTLVGARLDTVADAVFYSAVILSAMITDLDLIRAETAWIVAAVGTYILSWIFSWIKFLRMPSYHTWAAKGSWALVGVGIVSLFAGWSPWPLRFALLAVALTNLEAIAITLALRKLKVNVPTLWHALSNQQN
jgi:CDP-diacylglycerol--glycerol-3-phosphate 3-phosphatidyltransferase